MRGKNERKYLHNDGLRFELPERNLIVGEEDLNVGPQNYKTYALTNF